MDIKFVNFPQNQFVVLSTHRNLSICDELNKQKIT